jgi:hypothetical protein
MLLTGAEDWVMWAPALERNLADADVAVINVRTADNAPINGTVAPLPTNTRNYE